MSFSNKTLLFSLLLLCISIGKCNSASAIEDKLYHILVIHSYGSNYPAYSDINEQIKENFKKENIKVQLKFFYLDCEHYFEKEELNIMYRFIDSIQSWKPDIILTNEDQATYSTLACHHPFLKTVPIIFSGVNFPNWEVLQSYSNVTGFWDKPDYVENAEMIERIFGKTRILFFHDETFLGKQVIKEMAIQFTNKKNRFANTWIFNSLENNDSVQITQKYTPLAGKLKSRFAHPDTTIFYYLNARKDNGGKIFWALSGMIKYAVFVQTKYDFVTMRIGKLAALPTFSVINEGVGYNNGVLGGYFTTKEIQAEEEVNYAARILKGENIKELPITQSRKKYVVDWQELQRWNIPLSNIPDNYEIINLPSYRKYSALFIGFIIGGITLLSILLISFINRKKKSKRIIVEPAKEDSPAIKSEIKHQTVIPETIIPPTIHTCVNKDCPIILIAEDNEANYLLLKSILNKHYTIVWVQNGKEAVKCINEQNIDIVLMDIKMPEMDGIEALKEIRKTHPNLPVIMQTAHAFDTDKKLAQQAGCSDFLTKPITAIDLKQAIEQFIS